MYLTTEDNGSAGTLSEETHVDSCKGHNAETAPRQFVKLKLLKRLQFIRNKNPPKEVEVLRQKTFR